MSSDTPSVLCVAGARPNFMKIAPVLDELERRGITNWLVHTGQHYDPAMSDVFFDELGIRAPDRHLEVGSGSHAQQTARIMEAFEPIVEDLRPDWVVVVGDVNSTVACALVAAKLGVKVAHVEAGLRSRDWSMPEEINRVVTDRLSQVLLAPSPDGVDNLLAEGFDDSQIHLVGNVMVDTLLMNLDRARGREIVNDLGLVPGNYALLTLHRPANVDDPHVFAGLLDAVAEVAAEVPVIYPVHPRVARRFDPHQDGEVVSLPPGIRLIEPVGYLDSIALQASARLVFTDSGGIQEETTVLGIPCLTLRPNTERPITITEGTNRLVGVEPAAIVTAAREVLRDGVEPRRPALWDGEARTRVVSAIVDFAG
jgi:UDP-N-acetylglucosamine 2-epimerase (non-hydrolysing)